MFQGQQLFVEPNMTYALLKTKITNNQFVSCPMRPRNKINSNRNRLCRCPKTKTASLGKPLKLQKMSPMKEPCGLP